MKKTAAKSAFTLAENDRRAYAEQERRRELAYAAKKQDWLLALSPLDFERHVAQLFEALGYAVQLTPIVNDEGVDMYLEKASVRAIVQCKRLTNGSVSRPMLQQFFGVLKDKLVEEGFFVTTGRFTNGAVAFAKSKPIHLVDVDKLVAMTDGAFTEEFIRFGPVGRVKESHFGLRRGRRRARRRWYR